MRKAGGVEARSTAETARAECGLEALKGFVGAGTPGQGLGLTAE